jgi:hypothetical protein
MSDIEFLYKRSVFKSDSSLDRQQDFHSTVRESALIAEIPFVSRTLTMNVDIPDLFVLPLITPVTLFRESPAGSLPDEIDQIYGDEPPVATSCAE